ncbi:MAG TPA: FtsH protease activity modulator HflK [Burkholderiales bacterium]|jgi:membrane protease subunit HflK|nr:FtsH protease activity modulator HflK [Burkholderiales bacterium]
MSLNDPNWGRGGSRGPGGGNQGPPDLDELWRNFNRRLSDLFGRKRPGGEPPRTPFGAPRFGGAGLIAGVVLAVWLASGFYIVVEGQRGIVLTFGKFAEETGAGLRWRLPWPIQSHEIVNVGRSRALEIGYRNNNVKTRVDKEALMLTDDENIVSVQFAVQYVVKPNEAQNYLFTNKRPDETAQHAAETAMREVIGKSKMDAILYESRAEINLAAKNLMQQILDRYRTGILVQTVTIQSAQPPQDVQAAFSDQQSASQDREKQKNEGEAYANDVIPKAKGTASRLTQEAEGYRQRVIASAEGDASRFKQILTEYSKAPAVTRERIYIETMQQILQTTSKVMLDYKGSGNLLYLPLDKLMQQSGMASAEAGRPPQPEAAPSADSSSRSRDRDLMRERGRGERP